jgi:hypothetical protein
LESALKLLDLILCHLVRYLIFVSEQICSVSYRRARAPTFANNGVEEIHTTESARNNGIHFAASALEANKSISANMRKYISFTHLNKRQFAVVAVSEEVCRTWLTQHAPFQCIAIHTLGKSWLVQTF